MTSQSKMVSRAEAQEIKVDNYLTVFDYITKEDNEDISFVTCALHGPHDNRVNKRSSKLYYILTGRLDVVVDGVSYSLEQNDTLLIPPGMWHEMKGVNCRMIITCSPAYDFEDEDVA